ncbi:uncharacterized protein THITE_110393 [Thermothielavioides terrestris NRRL 8126]|uniref:Uncharacterized protein n=1 Tax=Thermothielavioides terrestris (strain ATCC 38088 / NRRL 8126) TaxID=578455 RepID=G2R324_THETT|nr:uncharacterized protein THITE_110393 [Thermothielavioides terrestris NRRL 8126]AEO66742.1 hypothetical protein THITE_110393 [Thermothielavioides terrestris NRRL 8126]
MPGTATTLTAEQPSPKPVATAAAAELRPRIPRAAVSLAEKPLTLWPIPFLPVPSANSLAHEAAQHTLEAGAVAALQLRPDPAPWLGARKGKGGQAAAAGGADAYSWVGAGEIKSNNI